jgi:DNA-binding MarR family transcriptional regulator
MAEEATVMAGQQILPLIEYLARVGRRAADASLTGCLRPRHLVALQMLDKRGPMPQHDLGPALSLDPSNVVGLLNELEERGLITRRRDRADRRRHIVSLSAGGEGELARTCSQLGTIEDELFSALSGEERATLYELLVRVVGGAPYPACAPAEPCEGTSACEVPGPGEPSC